MTVSSLHCCAPLGRAESLAAVTDNEDETISPQPDALSRLPWSALPSDIQKTILGCLAPPDLARFGSASRQTQAMSEMSDAWTALSLWSPETNPQAARRSLAATLNAAGVRYGSAGKIFSFAKQTPCRNAAAFVHLVDDVMFHELTELWLADQEGKAPTAALFKLRSAIESLYCHATQRLELKSFCLNSLPDCFRFLNSLTTVFLEKISFCDPVSMQLISAPNLTSLTITRCHHIPTLAVPPQKNTKLRFLSVTCCDSLCMVDENVASLSALQTLTLNDNISLEKLPSSLAKMSWLEELNLADCSSLTGILSTLLHQINLRLKVVDISRCSALTECAFLLANNERLESFTAAGCSRLEKFPSCFEVPARQRTMILDECSTLIEPPELSAVNALEAISLNDCHALRDVNSLFTKASQIQHASMKNCLGVAFVPPALYSLQRLESLSLEGTSIAEISLTPSAFASLRSLDLGHCPNLSYVDESIGGLKNLELLSLAFCPSLRFLPQSLGQCKGLVSLILNDCENLSYVPESLGHLNGLKSLYLGRCRGLTRLPAQLSSLVNLKMLYLDGCTNLNGVPERLCKLNLYALDLHECRAMESLPSHLGDMKALRGLHLGECTKLTSLAPVAGLDRLEVLMLYGCHQFDNVPDEISTLVGLQTMSLNGWASLETLPLWFRTISNLRELNVGSCESLRTVDVLTSLRLLRNLDLSNCFAINCIPEDVSGLVNLERVTLENCSALSALPKSLSSCVALTNLNLVGCDGLTNFPEELWNLPKLTTIELGSLRFPLPIPRVHPHGRAVIKEFTAIDCPFLEFNEAFVSGLPNLTSLHLDSCSSPRLLPASLPHHLPLRSLELKMCDQVYALPRGLSNLSRLQRLVLHGNRRLEDCADFCRDFPLVSALSIRDNKSRVAVLVQR